MEESVSNEEIGLTLLSLALLDVELEERTILLQLFLTYIRFLLAPTEEYPEWVGYVYGSPVRSSAAFACITRALTEPKCADNVWTWFIAIMEEAQGCSLAQSRIKISVFENFLEGGVDWNNSAVSLFVHRMFECWRNPRTQWVIYKCCEMLTREQCDYYLRVHNQWCLESGRAPLAINTEKCEFLCKDNGDDVVHD